MRLLITPNEQQARLDKFVADLQVLLNKHKVYLMDPDGWSSLLVGFLGLKENKIITVQQDVLRAGSIRAISLAVKAGTLSD